MNDDHARWRRQVLALDDLEGEQRTAAQAHLQACPECATMLQRLREHERAPAQLGAWGAAAFGAVDAAGDVPQLAPRERAAAEASLADLQARIPQRPQLEPKGAPAGRPSHGRGLGRGTARVTRRWWVWAAPLAVAAGVVLLLVAPEAGLVLEGSLQLLPAGAQRGIEQSPPIEWRTGDAFALRFELRSPGYPVVFHVDPRGGVAVLHPASSAGPALQPTPAGTTELPDPATDDQWVFSGEGGTETFLLAVPRTRPTGLEELGTRLEALYQPGATGAARLEALQRALERELGPVQVAQARHSP